MKLNKLQPLKSLDTLQGIKPLIKTRVSINNKLLNEIEIILYSTNLCLFAARILREEIQIQNRNAVLSIIEAKINELYNLLSKKDFLLYSNYTKKDKEKFFNKIGLKPKHISIID